MKRLFLWIIGLLAAFFLFALIGEQIGNGVFIVIAFAAAVVVLFIKYWNGRNKTKQ